MTFPWPKIAVCLFCKAWMCLCIAWSTTTYASDLPVKWDALKSASVEPFVDPFSILTSSQIYKLATLARLLQLGSKPDDGTDSGRELADLYAQLGEDGVDVDYLLSKREEIARKRRNASLQINPDIVGQAIEIVGFPLPAALTDGNRSSFFLVPFAGICAHVALPLPNQIILISSDDSHTDLDFRKSVKVRGVIKEEQGRHRVLLFDGPATVVHAYGIKDADVSSMAAASASTKAEIGGRSAYFNNPLRKSRTILPKRQGIPSRSPVK